MLTRHDVELMRAMRSLDHDDGDRPRKKRGCLSVATIGLLFQIVACLCIIVSVIQFAQSRGAM